MEDVFTPERRKNDKKGLGGHAVVGLVRLGTYSYCTDAPQLHADDLMAGPKSISLTGPTHQSGEPHCPELLAKLARWPDGGDRPVRVAS